MIDPLAASERAKYERMWAFPQYRVWSPGEDSADEAMAIFGTSSVVDFGCGEGRALDKFLDAGMEADLLDKRAQTEISETPFPSQKLVEHRSEVIVLCSEKMEVPYQKFRVARAKLRKARCAE
jgi:hypothetical protein